MVFCLLTISGPMALWLPRLPVLRLPGANLSVSGTDMENLEVTSDVMDWPVSRIKSLLSLLTEFIILDFGWLLILGKWLDV